MTHDTKNSFAFFGTPDVAVKTLDILFTHGFVPTIIVTSPDRPSGRGLTLTPPPVKVWAQEHTIPCLQPEIIDSEFIATLQSYNFNLSIVVAYGKILPQELIDLPEKGTLNIHYSLLPRYRGASPVESAILNGDTETGVTIQQMVFKLDAGNIIAQESTPIGNDETTPELRDRLIVIGGELLANVLPSVWNGVATNTVQDETLVTRSRKMTKESGLIDLSDDSKTNYNKYRAYKLWPRTYFFSEKNGLPTGQAGKQTRVVITKASLVNNVFTPLLVIPEGKKEIKYEDFLRNN